MIAGNSVIEKGNESVSLVTQPSLNITEAKQLKGRKVGVPGLMSVADVVFRKWLKDQGISAKDITFVEVPFPRMADMMKAGTVDAVVTAEPVLGALVKNGLAERKAGEYYSQAAPDAVITLWASTTEWAKSHPAQVRAFNTCLVESVAWIKKNREKAGEISQKYLNFNPPFTPSWRPAITAADIDFFAGVSKDFDLIRRPVDAKKVLYSAQ